MKIIIVGGGIGGLSAYHALKKHLFDSNVKSSTLSITIIESHPTPSRTVGGGVGLAPNGLRALASIFPDAVSYIQERSFPGPELTFRNAKSDLIGIFKVGTPERYGYGMRMLPRHVAHQALLVGIPERDIRWGMKVAGVRESGSEVEVEYADGTTETADLVIGADGVRSTVKNSLFDCAFEAKYDGLTAVSGFINLDELPTGLQEGLKTHGVTMTFGQKAFFGYGMCSPLPDSDSEPSESSPSEIPPFIQWWSVYECAVIPERKDLDYSALKAQLLARHGDWKSPYDDVDTTKLENAHIFRRLIELGCRPTTGDITESELETETGKKPALDASVMILPRYITPRLPYWSNANCLGIPLESQGRIVLMGDAAHTMPPDVGQGVSCAAEDAVVYALLLKHYLTLAQDSSSASGSNLDSHSTAIGMETPFSLAAKAYEELRKPHIHSILDSAKWRGNAKKEMSTIGQFFRDFGMHIASKLPESWKDYVFAYDAEAAVTNYLAAKSEVRRGWW